MIGVVGGGIAGLAAAYRLQERGHEVQVFEATGDVGGLAAVYDTDGDAIEKFYHHLSASEETIVELAEDLGLGDRVEWRYKTDAFYVDGVVHPMEKAWEIAAFPHLSLYDKFRLAMLVLEVDVSGGLPELDAYGDLEEYEDVTAIDFLHEHTTDRVYETFWKPLLQAKFGSRMGDVSAAWLLGRIRFRGERHPIWGEQLGYFEGGFHTLIDALIEAVGRENIETGARVTDIGIDDGAVSGLTVETGASADGGTATSADGGAVESVDGGTAETAGGSREYDVDGVVVATMPHVLESLTGYPCDVDFQGTVCSVLSMDEALTDTYWLNIADDAPFGALIEHTNFVPPARYGGEHLLYAVKYVQSMDDPLWQMDDEGVEETWLTGIEDLFPEFDRESVNWIETSRSPKTAPIYERGYLEKVIPYDLSEYVAEGVYYAGMASRAQYPERSLNGAIVAGETCAELIDDAE